MAPCNFVEIETSNQSKRHGGPIPNNTETTPGVTLCQVHLECSLYSRPHQLAIIIRELVLLGILF